MANQLIPIIEDNEKNRKLVRDVLQFKGYQTVESETAEEGIRLARGKKAGAGADGPSPAPHERHRDV